MKETRVVVVCGVAGEFGISVGAAQFSVDDGESGICAGVAQLSGVGVSLSWCSFQRARAATTLSLFVSGRGLFFFTLVFGCLRCLSGLEMFRVHLCHSIFRRFSLLVGDLGTVGIGMLSVSLRTGALQPL